MQATDDSLQEIHSILDRLCPADDIPYLQARPWLYETMAQYLFDQGRGEHTLDECRMAVVSYIHLEQAKRRKRIKSTLTILSSRG